MATQTVLSEQTEKIAQKYVRKVQSLGIKVSDALIFGSQVNGKAGPNSDIDLAIVSPEFGKSKHRELVKLFKLIDLETKKVEPIPISSQELEDEYDPLILEIRKNGISILNNTP